MGAPISFIDYFRNEIKLGDDKNLYFGDGKDISIDFTDGTGLQIKGIAANENIFIGDSTYAVTLNQGTSASPMVLTAGTPSRTLYTTCASTSGSASAESFYSKTVMTGIGGVGGRGRFHLYTNVALGGWANALKAHAEMGSSGKVTGLMSAMNVELAMPNVNMGTGGAYYALEINYVAGGSSLVTAGGPAGNQAGFIKMGNSGDADGDFDDHGFLCWIDGLTAGSTHLYSTSASGATGDATLKINIGGVIKYLLVADDAS